MDPRLRGDDDMDPRLRGDDDVILGRQDLDPLINHFK